MIVDGDVVGRIESGLLIYLGVLPDDSEADVRYIADKVRHLRIFPDASKPMNRDVAEIGGSVLVVSAFSTVGDARRGRRPSFSSAADGPTAEPMYEQVCEEIESLGLKVERGRFAQHMDVQSINDGPICILLDSRKSF